MQQSIGPDGCYKHWMMLISHNIQIKCKCIYKASFFMKQPNIEINSHRERTIKVLNAPHYSITMSYQHRSGLRQIRQVFPAGNLTFFNFEDIPLSCKFSVQNWKEQSFWPVAFENLPVNSGRISQCSNCWTPVRDKQTGQIFFTIWWFATREPCCHFQCTVYTTSV